MKTNLPVAKKERRVHTAVTWFLVLVLVVAALAIMGLSARFLRAQLVLGLLFGAIALHIAIFAFSHRIVVTLMSCVKPDVTTLARLEPMVKDLTLRAGLKRVPRIYVSEFPMPNAFAFGHGIGGNYGIAVTKPIMEILNDNELRAVLGHEIGHLRARDTAMMTVISICLGFINMAVSRFRHVGRAALAVAVLMELVIYIPRMIAASISRVREMSADVHSAILLETPQHLIDGFEMMNMWYEENKGALPARMTPLDELLLSHPKMTHRQEYLRDVIAQEKEEEE